MTAEQCAGRDAKLPHESGSSCEEDACVEGKTGCKHPVSVCLLISSLEFGGAERQVVELVRTFDRRRVKPVICSLSRQVPLAEFLPNQGADLRIIEKRGRFDFTTVFRVAKLLRECRVDVVHAFMTDSEIVARLAAVFAGRPVVVASERNTDYCLAPFPRLALKTTLPLIDVMVANSTAGKEFNVRTMGLNPSRIQVVHNGVDVERFRPDPQVGGKFRAEFGIASNGPVIGMVGSFKRQKGHEVFLRMAAKVLESHPRATFLVVGGVIEDKEDASQNYKSEVMHLAATLRLGDRCRFLGTHANMTAVYNACDVTVLLSHHEGTPNVVLESMACGVPVIATDVSDNGLIIQDSVSGYVVPRADSATAACRLIELILDPDKRKHMGETARERVSREFSLQRAAEKLEEIYRASLEIKRANCSSVTHVRTLARP